MKKSLSRVTASFKKFGLTATEAVDRMTELAEALRGEQPDLPEVGEYIRITNEHDLNYGQIGEVTEVENEPSRKTVHFKLDPFGTGGVVKLLRPIDPGCYEILTEMEVLAEASR